MTRRRLEHRHGAHDGWHADRKKRGGLPTGALHRGLPTTRRATTLRCSCTGPPERRVPAMHPLTRGRDCSCVVEGMRRVTSPAFTIADEWHPRHVIPGAKPLRLSRQIRRSGVTRVFHADESQARFCARQWPRSREITRARYGKCGEVILATRSAPSSPPPLQSSSTPVYSAMESSVKFCTAKSSDS